MAEDLASLIESGRRTTSTSYAPAPVVLERGDGMWLYDAEGRAYLDFLSGIAVSALGHAHPRLVRAIADQAARVLHVSNAFFTRPQIELQSALTSASGLDRVFFTNSGAEANEAAIKLARRWQRTVARTPRFEIITFRQSFHGRTMGAISATAQPKYHAGFEPILPGFVYAEFQSLASVRELIGAHTAAILVEPVQGEGGVRPADPAFLAGLRSICDEHGLLLILDEVQSGMGRTGTLFAFEQYGIRPDILCLAKGIGGGVPLGAMLATEDAFRGFERGSHATTYGGNPLACAAGLAVLGAIADEGLLARVAETGARLRAGAEALRGRHPGIVDVRGRGQLNGIEVDPGQIDATRVVAAAREQGLLINVAGPVTLRLVPPLIAELEHVDEALARLDRALQAGRVAEGA